MTVSTPNSPILAGERVAFTGTLASMTHAQAAQLVADHGGTASEHVSRHTTLLVVGEEGWPLEADGQPSVKLQQAQRLQSEGVVVRILNESEWLRALGLSEQEAEVRRLYTPAMLSGMLKVSVHLIRGWERLGLIRAVKRIYRLPYFDFQEVNSVQRLNDLLHAGVPRHELETSLRGLPSVLRGDVRPLEQLEILASDERILVRDEHGLLIPSTRQRVFSFEEPKPLPARPAPDDPAPFTLRLDHAWAPEAESAQEWFQRGCTHTDQGELTEAVEAFRMALMAGPATADMQFHLAEALFRTNNPRGALERYYATVELDHDYLEAWTQIGSLHREVGESEAALLAFDIALNVHPDYPDAVLQKAETLAELGRGDEAVELWNKYLTFDSRSPWADLARQRLEAWQSPLDSSPE
jgi:tetratricopeptide (TPR) repeat protein